MSMTPPFTNRTTWEMSVFTSSDGFAAVVREVNLGQSISLECDVKASVSTKIGADKPRRRGQKVTGGKCLSGSVHLMVAWCTERGEPRVPENASQSLHLRPTDGSRVGEWEQAKSGFIKREQTQRHRVKRKGVKRSGRLQMVIQLQKWK